MYKIVNSMEKTDRQDLVSLFEDGDRQTRGHCKTMKSQCLRHIKKFSFPHGTAHIWNSLNDEIVTAESVHKFKENVDKIRYGDG
ncbi:hypothetical protein E2C01_082794 [Portunus trituberculatus]|uniref:Uncharacterized protein n=1 Tax=Portunus trituberculatus TaxID=210409 RepID=A0A5B7J635_PORTR|nr:hypothetical protein [Portunus trituberculatus]